MIVQAREKIKEVLDGMVTDGDLGTVIEKFGVDAFKVTETRQPYPVAILYPSFLNTSVNETFTSNMRTYSIAISLVFKNTDGNLPVNTVEGAVEKFLNNFDNKLTLDGTIAYISPSTAPAMEIEEAKGFIEAGVLLNINIKADLNFLGQ